MPTYIDVNPRYGQSSLPLLVADEQAINSAIDNIFGTNIGERWWYPPFGGELKQFIFDPLDDATCDDIQTFCIMALKRWEPRIVVIQAVVSANLVDNCFDIFIRYKYTPLNLTGKYVASLKRS